MQSIDELFQANQARETGRVFAVAYFCLAVKLRLARLLSLNLKVPVSRCCLFVRLAWWMCFIFILFCLCVFLPSLAYSSSVPLAPILHYD